jgi:hypothetical protein
MSMANKPEWADSPNPESPDGTAEMLAECLVNAERIVFWEENNRYFAIVHYRGKNTNRSRNSFRDLIIALQELLL